MKLDQDARSDLTCGPTSNDGPPGDSKTSSTSSRGKSVRLLLYYDDFVVSCPIGNKTVQYKIGGIYFAVANLSRNARLENINLALLFHASHVKQYSWARILKPLVDDLKILETQGIRVVWNDCVETVKGVVELVIGDNLAIHDISGFFCSFHQTKRVCRFCHATSTDIQSKFEKSEFAPRSKQEYDAEMRILSADNFASDVCKVFGIKSKCVLNELKSFHVSEQTPGDISHDLFEGVALYAVNSVLTSLFALRVVDKDMLRKMVNEFPYHRTDVNRPQAPVVTHSSVTARQTCSESWTLLRLLPLMVYFVMGDREMSEECESKIDIIRKLIKITQVLMSETDDEADIIRMEKAISDWLKEFRNQYPEYHMKPKFNYLVHYGDHMRKYGPPRRYATIRFEAKHQELKEYLRVSKNRRNVCATMAKKHQVTMSVKSADPSFLCSGVTNVSTSHYDPPQLDLAQILPSRMEDDVVKSATYCGTKYCAGDVVVQKSGNVKLVLICCLLVAHDRGSFQFIVEECEVVHYDEKLQAFRVVPRKSQPYIMHLNDLAHHQPLGMYHIRAKNFVVLRNIIK